MILAHKRNRLYTIQFVALRKIKLYYVEEITLLDQMPRQQSLFKPAISKLIDLITNMIDNAPLTFILQALASAESFSQIRALPS